MPVSKRDKKVSLTKTTKKGMAMKQQLVEDVRKFLDKYENLFVFTTNNMRNGPLKDLREEWKDSRFFFAKRKIMALALGRTEADEVQKNLHKISSHLVGQCGLLFTNRPKDNVVQWFRDFSQMEFAKSGFVATETVVLPAGPMPEFSFSLEPHLRSLGLPTQLEKGKIILREDYTVCSLGSKLTPEQANILKLIGKQMAEFKIKIVCMWSKDGSFERFKVPKEAKQLPEESSSKPQKKLSSSKSKKSEKELTKLFDQHTISEPEALNVENNLNSAESESTMEDETMTEESEQLTTSEEVEPSLVNKSETVKSKKSVQVVVEENDENKESVNKESDDTVTVKASTKKSARKSTQVKSEDKVSKEEELEHSEASRPGEESPKVTRVNPRRSLRTPKPIRRTPEEKKQSVKKLTESSKKTKSAVKDRVARPTRNTPRKSVSKKIFEEPEDVEMAE
ncbi:mRNA turnover protein 4 homolog [Macrosteles quadrilineatus]|uniref:mRNA turnover protein 4 homolog n=1 Tax=Macrosteles quadrilineatus TaxID=74068 RepID=UPI0023E281F2|nr:mRNA turnover protein 4 homolog [Macrosteles quadrilineatus]